MINNINVRLMQLEWIRKGLKWIIHEFNKILELFCLTTSLPRCHLSQVHNDQHKPRKKFSWGLKQIWSKGLESVLPVAHRTVSGAPGRAPREQATLGFSQGALCYNSPDCPVCIGHVRWANGATVTLHQRSTAKENNASQKSKQKVRTHRTCPVCHRTVRCS
jgi:hypothetical protein